MDVLVHSESSNQQSHPQTHHETGPLALLFIFFGLLCGCILREINKKTGVPYTPMLLVLGIIFGYCRQDLGAVGQSITVISSMSPHMILFVFIPILIFESAFNCDWHVFRKSMLNILLLAGPGVLWGAIIIAIMFKMLLGYDNDDLTWYEALALGCVLSATDPVAVVALLKELGASVQFNILVEGESLLNDGTAMVFFMLFMSLVKGQSASALDVVSNFVRVSLGGPLLGIIVGFIICWWLKKIIRDTILTVMITFLGTFLCFYIAQFTWLKVSGILSIVSLGLFFSAVGKLKIYPQSQHALHTVWASIQYGSETLIFILTGIVVGIKMIDQTTITTGDWVKMFIFWVLMIISRVIMVLTFYPFLTRSGYGISSKELIVLIYGGLRGALGMCLSLFVGVDQSLRLRFRELTVFYMCGMAMLTIVVNGLTCNKLVNYLQMIKVPQIKQKLLKRCVKKVLQSTQLKLKQLKSSTSVSYAKWKIVERDANVKQFGGTFHQRQSRRQVQLRDSIKQLRRSDVVQEIRFRFCSFLHRVVWQFYQQGQLSEESVKLLNSTCNIANDQIRFKLRFFDILSGFFDMESIEYYLKFKNTPIIGKYCTRSAIHKIYLFYQSSTAFVQACEQVLHKFQDSFPVSNQQLNYVLDEVKQSVQSAQAYISELQNGYPKIIQAVHTQRATTILLKSKRNQLKHYYEQGFIDDGDYSRLRKEIDSTLVQIRSSNEKLQQMKMGQIFSQYPLFSELTSQQLSELRMKAKDKTYQKGTILIKRDTPIKYVTILISGSVKQQFKDQYGKFYLIRSLGCVLDAYDFTYMQDAKCEAKARNTVRVLQIQQGYIRELLNNNTEFKKRWYKSLFVYCQHIHFGLQTIYRNLTQKEIRRLVEKSEVCLMSPDNRITKQSRTKQTPSILQVSHGAFIFDGQIEFERNTYVKGSFIPAGTIKCLTSKTVVLKFQVAARRLERGSVVNEKLNDDD